MENVINAAIQVLPKTKNSDDYTVIDKAIEIIQNSGLPYKVCPFETVVEGKYSEIVELIGQLRDTCYTHGADSVIINLKLHMANDKDVYIAEKMKKYE